MKYENFDTASKAVETIKEHESFLRRLNRQVSVIIIEHNSDTPSIKYIPCFGEGNEYQEQATALLDYIKKDIETRIENLKSSLELL